MPSLLNTNTKTAIQLKAEHLKRLPAQQFTQLLRIWEQGISMVWDDKNPQGVLDELGTSAVELFQLSGATAAYLESLQAGCTATAAAKVKPFTPNLDGTITIIVQEPPVEEEPIPE